MDLPPTSRIGFLDQAGNSINSPVEWSPALIEVHVKPQDWEKVRLTRQRNEELPISLVRQGGRARIIAHWPPSGTGYYYLTIHIGDAKIEEQIITIQPRKISTAAYAQLLEDLELRLPAAIALGLQRNAALAGLKILPPEESTLAMELARLGRAIKGSTEHMGLAQVLNELARDPHKVLRTAELWMLRERARRPHPSRLTQAMSRPYNLDIHGIPIRLLDMRVEHSVDVYENRLVKVYYHLVDQRLRRLKHILETRSNNSLLEEIQKLGDTLGIARRKAAFLDEVLFPSYLPTQNTMVLLNRPAYHSALAGYLEFHSSLGVYLEESVLEAPLENLPYLYQTWGTLEVFSILLDVTGTLGYQIIEQSLAKKDARGVFIKLLPDGLPIVVLKHPVHGTIIKVIPERTYKRQGQIYNISQERFHSVSFEQRPDIAIEILPPEGSPGIYLFDPKYKLNSEQLEEGQGNGKAKKEDIDKMHTYRDAIRDNELQRVVQYAAIIYPGSVQRYDHGIEALRGYPGEEQILEDRLRSIFLTALKT